MDATVITERLSLLLLTSMTTAGIVYLLAATSISAPLRQRLAEATMYPPITRRRRLQHWLHALLNCTYCLSVWIAAAVTPIIVLPDWPGVLLLFMPTIVGAWIILRHV